MDIDQGAPRIKGSLNEEGRSHRIDKALGGKKPTKKIPTAHLKGGTVRTRIMIRAVVNQVVPQTDFEVDGSELRETNTRSESNTGRSKPFGFARRVSILAKKAGAGPSVML